MQQYRINFDGDRHPTLSFEAKNLGGALAQLAARHADGRAELWREGQFLGWLELIAGEEGSFWRLA